MEIKKEDLDIRECENFFPPLIHREIYNIIMNKEVRWQYLPTITASDKKLVTPWEISNKIQESDAFVYPIEEHQKEFSALSKYFSIFVRQKFDINVDKIFRMMLVLIPPNPLYNREKNLAPHIDLIPLATEKNIEATKLKYKKLKNFLYYIEDNDAETLFFNQKHEVHQDPDYTKQDIIHRIQPKKNKAIIFDSSQYHAGNVSNTYKRLTFNILFYTE